MTNRLANANSLYLRQHAENPVQWHPWDDEALTLARRERKPILLSIGYSACHWCHVMAHESFEDVGTAQAMNALFVNIKVDREERPDLDRIYQLAHQALSRRGGGWPLTVFLTPDDLVPFYAGTYFPPTAKHGLPAFVEVLHGVRRWFDEHPLELAQQTAALSEFLADYGRGEAPSGELDESLIARARSNIAASFDAEHGGHRGGPKFPPGTELELLQRLARDGDAEAAAMAHLTLRRMAERGLHDHLGGGFFRYCVDAHWGIPHFEKMLYDNAALLALYANASEDEFRSAAAGIVDWLQREMRVPGGGYASAMDADSEGEEGRYYLWTREQIAAAIPASSVPGFSATYGLDFPPNFEGHAWHLQRMGALAEPNQWQAEREALLQVREQRVPPARDDKRLTSWNAMTVRALSRAATNLQREAWLTLADTTLDALRRSAWSDGVLYALAPEGGTRIAGFLDDHAFLLDALIERLQAGWSDANLVWASELAQVLLDEFEDSERGGFWFTRHSHEPLPQRPKPWFDESTPSGNAVAARALLRLGYLTGETRWLDAAERSLRVGAAAVREAPHGACSLIAALQEFLHPSEVIVLRATAQERGRWDTWLAAVRGRGAQTYVLDETVTALADKPHRGGGVAYVCRGMQCSAPMVDPAGSPYGAL